MTYVLGISAFYHDSAAALLKDGEIISAAQEERFTRKKHDSSFPSNSINFILKNSNIKIDQVDYIVFYEKPFLKFERLLETYLAFAPKGLKSFLMAIPLWLKEKLFQKKLILDSLNESVGKLKKDTKIYFSEHHLSHAASAFYPSPFNEAIILTLDGVGEWTTTSVAIGSKNNIDIVKEIHFPHSLGLLYSAFTYYAGFEVNGGEYKLMGLAPYGTPKYKEIILDKLINIKDDGSFQLNMKYFNYPVGLTMTNSNFSKLFGQPVRSPDTKIDKFHMDIAASIQKATEEIVIKIVKSLKKKYNINHLCLAGGVALNCVVNGKIINQKLFKEVWIQPAAGDAGGSLGAALAMWHLELKKDRIINQADQMKGSYLGPCFTNEEVAAELEAIGANYENLSTEKMTNLVAKKISEGNSVGWFQGKMEFGPRALGSRSIIADPRNKDMQKNLNLKIKYRESFRPFAPAILESKVSEWFDLSEKSPYMLVVANILDKVKISEIQNEKYEGLDKLKVKRSQIPAVTHVDYSARIQTVNKSNNLKFYNLIEKFEEITNCPILINTSFNVRDEPIVNSILDAYRCFMSTDLDMLVIENCVLQKKKQII
tara:strand:- start:1198 stop:2991 length:1794 start_codon:yes stop_codon:yes gene_type:complete